MLGTKGGVGLSFGGIAWCNSVDNFEVPPEIGRGESWILFLKTLIKCVRSYFTGINRDSS